MPIVLLFEAKCDNILEMPTPERFSNEEAKELPCIFCSITRGESESSIVEKNDRLHVIISLEGTPLIIPNKHIISPTEDPELATEMFEKGIELIPAICRAYGTNDYNIVSNVGKSAGQEVSHFHTHILPRHAGDGLAKFAFTPSKPRKMLNELAQTLKIETRK